MVGLTFAELLGSSCFSESWFLSFFDSGVSFEEFFWFEYGSVVGVYFEECATDAES